MSLKTDVMPLETCVLQVSGHALKARQVCHELHGFVVFKGFGFRVLGFRVQGLEFRVLGFRFSGFRV